MRLARDKLPSLAGCAPVSPTMADVSKPASRPRLPKEVREYLKRLGQKTGAEGAKAAAARMTPKARSERGRKAGLARQRKKREQ